MVRTRKLRLLVLSGLLFLALTDAAQLCTYNYRKRITIDPARVSGPSDLSNFPVLINITTDNDLRTVANSGHVENANGYDIVFTAVDGVSLLEFQRETYNATNGNYTAWVKIPTLSTTYSTVIYMYYGNTAIAADQSTTSVWGGYHGVWHFQNNSFADATANGYNGTNNGTVNQAAAQINNGRNLDGTDWIELGASFPNLNSNFSISAWINAVNRGTAGQRIFCDDVLNTGGYGFSLGDAGGANNGRLRFFSRASTTVILDAPANSISANNTWFHVVAVADITNNTRRIFINGVQVASLVSAGWGTDNGNCSIGGETAAGETANRFNGLMDEVRVASSALSADWIATEYNNQSSPATFYSISTEPKVWTGGTSTNMSTASNWLNNSVPASGDDVIITNGSNQPLLQSSIQYNGLYIRSGAVLSLGANTLSIRSDINNCGTLNGTSGGLSLNSTSSFVQTQYLSGTGVYTLNNLTINNTFGTSPQITLNKDVNVDGALTLSSGLVNTTASNILALGSGATSSSGSASSYISGPASKTGTTNLVFPMGKNGLWRRIGISNVSSSSTFRAEYFNSTPTGTTTISAPLYNISLIEYWQLDRLVGAGSANVSLYWENATLSGINNCPDLTVARYNGATWIEEPGVTLGGSSCSAAGTGTITTTTVVASFSPFSFGSKTYLVNPLPVELLGFSASCGSDGMHIEWQSASEKNLDYYVVERSADGHIWETVKQVDAAGNSNVQKSYAVLLPVFSDDLLYFRLKQVDKDGSVKYSQLSSLLCSESVKFLRVYPNPASDILTIELSQGFMYSGNEHLSLYNALGKRVVYQSLKPKSSRMELVLPPDLPEGIYFLKLDPDAHPAQVCKIILQKN